MSETAGSPSQTGNTERKFRVRMIYHPTLHVKDLDTTEEFFARVFGRSSTNLSSIMTAPPAPGHATDYSTFTSISDVLIDSLDPQRYVTGGRQRYPDIEQPHLKTFGWYVDGNVELYHELARRGIRVTNSRDEILVGDEPVSGPLPIFHSLRDDVGIRYHFFPIFPFPRTRGSIRAGRFRPCRTTTPSESSSARTTRS